MDAAAYARQLKQLLPRGSLWDLEPGSVLSSLLLAFADELARIDARAASLVEEWDPRSAIETLSEWEGALGLPETGQVLATVIASRQADVTRKYLAQGGATAAYFIGVAARLGFTVTVDYPSAFTWRLTIAPGAPGVSSSVFRMGTRVGARLVTTGSTEFERVINRLKPAHTNVLFLYL